MHAPSDVLTQLRLLALSIQGIMDADEQPFGPVQISVPVVFIANVDGAAYGAEHGQCTADTSKNQCGIRDGSRGWPCSLAS